MVLELAYAVLSKVFPSEHWLGLGFVVIGAILLRTFSQGRKTTRERNLNARVILVTVAWPELLLTSFRDLPWDCAELGWLYARRFDSASGIGPTRGAYNRTVPGTDFITTR